MELRQLRYFLAVADELHFTRAAQRLRIAGPSLSQQIKALERQLKVRLFDRSSTGVSLTPAGTTLLPLARAAVDAADEVTAAAARLAAGHAAVVRVGFQPFAFTTAARELLAAFAAREPTVEVRLRQYEWDDPSAGLLTGEVDVAIVRPPFRDDSTLRMVDLDSDQLLMVMPEGHPLARRPRVQLADALAQRFLESSLVTDQRFAAFWYLRDIRTADAVPSRAATVEEWLAEITIGRGVNLIPAGFAADYRRPGLAFRPVDGLPPTRTVLAWKATTVHDAAHRLHQLAAREIGHRTGGS